MDQQSLNLIDHTFGDKDLDDHNITYTVSKLSENNQHTLIEIKDALMINDEEEGFTTPLDGENNNHNASDILNIQINPGGRNRSSLDNINKSIKKGT